VRHGSAYTVVRAMNAVLLSSRKVLVLEDQFSSPCPCPHPWVSSPWQQHWMNAINVKCHFSGSYSSETLGQDPKIASLIDSIYVQCMTTCFWVHFEVQFLYAGSCTVWVNFRLFFCTCSMRCVDSKFVYEQMSRLVMHCVFNCRYSGVVRSRCEIRTHHSEWME